MLTSKPTTVCPGDIFLSNNSLIASNLGLAHLAARRVWETFPRVEFDDLVQESALALSKASQHFDPRRGVCFASYAYAACFRRCRKFCRREKRIACPSLPQKELCATRQASPDEQVQAEDSLDHAMRRLPGRTREIFRRRLAGEPRTQISRSLGLSRQRIGVCENEAMTAVRAAMG
jgi:RNA polymerase sigma factor (sigma-70 family)